MRMIGANTGALLDDMDAALRDLTSPLERDPQLWTRGYPGKWSAGQHADHVARGLRVTADLLERSEEVLREGRLGKRPARGPLQALFVGIVVGGGHFPRGGKAPEVIVPATRPDRAEVLEEIARGAERHRALAGRLSVEDRDRLWIRNPFLTRWHYTFPEEVRMQAVHARHHARQVQEIAARSEAGRVGIAS